MLGSLTMAGCTADQRFRQAAHWRWTANGFPTSSPSAFWRIRIIEVVHQRVDHLPEGQGSLPPVR